MRVPTSLLAIVVLCLFLTTAATTSNAALVSTTLSNVLIGSDLYNVTFLQDSDGDTSFNDVFGTGIPELTFFDSADALAAASAVRSVADALDFVVAPISAPFPNGFALPFSFSATEYSYFAVWSDSLPFDGVFGPSTRGRDDGLAGSFATFERIAAAPEPGTLTLLGLGLAGLAASRRRKQ